MENELHKSDTCVLEKQREKWKELYIGFIDWEKFAKYVKGNFEGF